MLQSPFGRKSLPIFTLCTLGAALVLSLSLASPVQAQTAATPAAPNPAAKDAPKDAAKATPREAGKDAAKASSKDAGKDAAKAAPKPAAAAEGDAAGPATSALPRVLLVPQQETTLVSQLVGRINSLSGSIGSSFRSGQPIVRMDCSENEAKLRISEAEFNSAKENLDAKQRLFQLRAAGETEVSIATSALEKARAQIEYARTQTRLCTIPAPFAGRIVKLHAREFQSVNVGQPIVDIVSSGPLKARLNAPSKWLAWLKTGTRFEIAIDETGKTYPATVIAINGRVDAVSQSIEIEGQIGGTFAELLAGMSGSARFAQAQ